MANTFVLVGSPLGLIGVQSRPTRDGMATFNGGKSRNVNVLAYNTGNKQATNIRRGERVLQSTVSLFSGNALPNFWGGISSVGVEPGADGAGERKTITRDTLHNNDVYDTSILNIIEKLSSTRASLRPQDFIYLKDLGVYPNNRLMIARKFSSPQKDNILDKGGSAPLSTIISWKKPEEDFLKITFGEEWGDAEADFTNVLNDLGKDIGIGGAGGGLGAGLNALPLPGFTEIIQREFLGALGILEKKSYTYKVGDPPIDETKTDFVLPSGDPNMIKKAKQRKLVGYGVADSGLYCDVSIKMETVYEQKFISGIDPTIAYMDIINNILTFGTQKSSNYGLTEEFRNRLNKWTGPGGIDILIKDVIELLGEAFKAITESIKDVFAEKSKSLDIDQERKKDLKNAIIAENNSGKGKVFDIDQNDSADNIIKAAKKNKPAFEVLQLDQAKESALQFGKDLIEKFKAGLGATLEKYKIRIMGIANALSGAPSTPWHVTIGNPLRPIFCSGDMLTERVDLELGKELAFNDLPSTFKVSFTLKNARPWGLEEILAKFNTGYVRTVNTRKDFTISPADDSYYFNPDDDDFLPKPEETPPTTPDGTNPAGSPVGGTASGEIPGDVQSGNTKVGDDAGASQNDQNNT